MWAECTHVGQATVALPELLLFKGALFCMNSRIHRHPHKSNKYML